MKVFKPEFLNRLDDIVIFNRIKESMMEAITEVQILPLRKQLAFHNLSLDIGEGVISHLAKLGYDPSYGARPLKRVIQRELQNLIADSILRGDFKNNQIIKVVMSGDNLVLKM